MNNLILNWKYIRKGGTDKRITSTTSGLIILLTNDAHTEDNSRGWSVSLTVNPLLTKARKK